MLDGRRSPNRDEAVRRKHHPSYDRLNHDNNTAHHLETVQIRGRLQPQAGATN